jgi:hypothetical protein
MDWRNSGSASWSRPSDLYSFAKLLRLRALSGGGRRQTDEDGRQGSQSGAAYIYDITFAGGDVHVGVIRA